MPGAPGVAGGRISFSNSELPNSIPSSDWISRIAGSAIFRRICFPAVALLSMGGTPATPMGSTIPLREVSPGLGGPGMFFRSTSGAPLDLFSAAFSGTLFAGTFAACRLLFLPEKSLVCFARIFLSLSVFAGSSFSMLSISLSAFFSSGILLNMIPSARSFLMSPLKLFSARNSSSLLSSPSLSVITRAFPARYP